jgi:hypothetical protein
MSAGNPFSNISQYYGDSDPNKTKRPSLANDNRSKPNNKAGYLQMTGLESNQSSLGYVTYNEDNYNKYL